MLTSIKGHGTQSTLIHQATVTKKGKTPMKENTLQVPRGYDLHCHLRRGEILTAVGPYTARQYKGALAMPNTTPPIETADDAEAYRTEIMNACGKGFEPIMAIMLTRRTTPQVVKEAGGCGIKVLKYIPMGVSTNSDESVALEELGDFYPVLDAVQESGMIFSSHWESLHNSAGEILPEIDREAEAIRFLDNIIGDFPGLKIVAEHASTKNMIGYIKQCPSNVAATLTVHHALLTYSDVCSDQGTVHSPHNYCKPVAKQPWDVAAVANAMASGNPRFFFGSDNAPHPLTAKKKTPPAAGIFNPLTLCMLCQIFEARGALDRLNNFVSKFGADFYGLPQNSETIKLAKKDWIVPDEYGGIVPFMAGQILHWQFVD